jgi:hypothetical protein
VDSAADVGVQHLVYSTGAPCSEMTQGKVQLDAYDSKSNAPLLAPQFIDQDNTRKIRH